MRTKSCQKKYWILIAALFLNAFLFVFAQQGFAVDNIQILGSWVSGTSHAKEPGNNRALLFFAHVEDDNADMNLVSVTYGGQPMTKVIERNVGSGSRVYVAAFILNEAGIAAASGTTFSRSWASSPYGTPAFSSVFLGNVDQLNLIGALASNGTTGGRTITTNPLSTVAGDMVFVAGTSSNTGSYTVNSSFVEGIEVAPSSADGVAGYKIAAGSAETPSITHSTKGRQVIIGFVVQAVEIAPPTGRILEAHFDAGSDGFTYLDDAFLGTNQAAYASGAHLTSGGYSGGALKVSLGGVDNALIEGMSGGWQRTFNLDTDATGVVLSFRYRLTQTGYYESDEYSRVLISINGTLYGNGLKNFVDHIGGDGGSTTASRSSGWIYFEVFLDALPAGNHTLTIGGYNNKKDYSNETTEVLIDDVLISSGNEAPPPDQGQGIVARLEINQFKSYIWALASFGDRCQMTGCDLADFNNAQNWLQGQLEAMGYTVERHYYTYNSTTRSNLYVTKIGTVHPNQMYMVSAHLDGRGDGGGADDDGSGSALVLEAARVFAAADVQTDVSIRFIWWGNEETGLNGSTTYVANRASLQGREDPPGSGRYPEPTWIGIIQHDMILYDHGNPAQVDQIAGADIDVEYKAGTTYAAASQSLANRLKMGSYSYSPDYPAEIGDSSQNTDDTPFQKYTASVSVRENRRCCEIYGVHPYYHTGYDLYQNYSDLDFLLGFNTVQMTVGTVAELAGARIIPASGGQ